MSTAAVETPTTLNNDALTLQHLVKTAKPATQEPPPAAASIPEEDLKALAKKLPNLLWGDPEKADAAPAAPAAPATPPPAAPATPDPAAPAAPAEPPAEPKLTVKQKETADFNELGKSVAANIAAELRAIMPPAAPAAPAAPTGPDPLAGLSPQDRRNYEAFVELSSTDPMYKGHPQKFLDYVNNLRDYKASWLRENPGKKFDLAEHEEFVDQHQPHYDEDDLQTAKLSVATKQTEARVRADMEKKLSAIREEARTPQVEAEAKRLAANAQAEFLSHLPDSEVKKTLLGENGVKTLQDNDPMAFEVLNTVVSDLQERVGELHNIHNRPGYFNPANPVHASIATFVKDQEQAIKRLPAGQQVHAGKMFATYEEMAAMPEAQRSRYWVLSESDISNVMTRKFSAVAAKNLESERVKLNEFIKKYGYSKAPVASPATPPATPASPATPAESKVTPPPAGGGGGKLSPTVGGGATPPVTQGQALVNALW